MILLTDVLILAALCALLVATTSALYQPQRPKPTPPLPDADEKADALPFGPAPRDSNH